MFALQIKKGKKLPLLLANLMEKFHIPLAFVALGFGRLWFSQTFYFFILTFIIFFQSYYKECPLTKIVAWLRQKYLPTYQYKKEKTFTWQFYNRYGKLAGIMAFIFWFTFSWLMTRIFKF